MYTRILVPIDGSSTSDRGLDEAIKLALLTGASLRLVHRVDCTLFTTGFDSAAVYAPEAILRQCQAGNALLKDRKSRAEKFGLRVDIALLEGQIESLAEAVVEDAKDSRADLLVIGTHGRRGMSRLLLGSDAEQILRIAPVPVLLIHGDVSVSAALETSTAVAGHPSTPEIAAA